jgi:hypothetical protein
VKTANEKFKEKVAGILNANIPDILAIASEALAGEIAKAAQEETAYFGYHDEFVNDILANTPESWDGDDAAEDIAVRYVRALELLAEIKFGRLPEPADGLERRK